MGRKSQAVQPGAEVDRPAGRRPEGLQQTRRKAKEQQYPGARRHRSKTSSWNGLALRRRYPGWVGIAATTPTRLCRGRDLSPSVTLNRRILLDKPEWIS